MAARVDVVGCTFTAQGAGVLLEIDRDALPPDIHLLIMDETISTPMGRDSITKAVAGRKGLVRVGPCPLCGRAAPYVDGKLFHEDVVECVMSS